MPDRSGYFITRLSVFANDTIPIAEEQYRGVVNAQNNLYMILGIEQKLEILLWNFAEYEEELLRCALYQSVWPGAPSESLTDGWSAINRRVLNLLAAARMYLDQLCHEMSACYGKTSAVYSAIIVHLSRQYDTVLAYRAMEGLRNHAQHKSLPVGTVTFGSEVEGRGDSATFRYSVTPTIDLADLRRHRAMKSSILQELATLADKPDLTELLRQYLGCICSSHVEWRRLTEADVTSWRATVGAARNRAAEIFGDDLSNITVVERDASGWNLVEQYIDDDYELRRLRRKNGILENLAARYVTSAKPTA